MPTQGIGTEESRVRLGPTPTMGLGVGALGSLWRKTPGFGLGNRLVPRRRKDHRRAPASQGAARHDSRTTAPQGPLFRAQSRKSVESSSVGSLAACALWGFRIPDSRFRIPGSFPFGNPESRIGNPDRVAAEGRVRKRDQGVSSCCCQSGCRIAAREGRRRGQAKTPASEGISGSIPPIAIRAGAAATGIARRASLAGLGLVHGQAATVILVLLESVDGRQGIGLALHFDKAEALRPPRVRSMMTWGLDGARMGEQRFEVGAWALSSGFRRTTSCPKGKLLKGRATTL